MKLLFASGYTQDIPMASGGTVPGNCKGIACCRFDESTGRLTPLSVTPSAPNPSCIAADPAAPYLYCANEMASHDEYPFDVSAYRFDPASGELFLLNQQPGAGTLACFVTLSPDAAHVLSASYNGGICLLNVGRDHRLSVPCACLLSAAYLGPDPQRQDKSHPHQVLLHPDGERVYVPDLGQDRLFCFRANWEKSFLQYDSLYDLSTRPGQGPRHGVCSANGRRLYVLTELSSELDVFDPDTTKLLQTLPALPPDCAVPGMAAAIRLHPSGKFLYASLRGPNLIAVFPIRPDGLLETPAFCPSGSQTPRDFLLTPDGRWLLTAGQDDGSICVHAVDPETGALSQVWREENMGTVTSLALWG